MARAIHQAAHHYELASRPRWITPDGIELSQRPRGPVRRPFQYERMLAKLPPAVRDSLTPQQLDCISDALIPDPPRHAIDYRASIPFFGRRFYVTLLVGRERRSLERLAREAQLRARHVAIIYSVLLMLVSCASFLAFVLVGYAEKRDGHRSHGWTLPAASVHLGWAPRGLAGFPASGPVVGSRNAH